ncbi:hypothetical protein M9980_07745 [Sphingomonas donggukensis]|uniref:DUF1570 domain-containing protein n=1 Tax=Sphingomonas donggukensis TaxID=2949093 RepID=A0ABY4TTF5_9SPHN|nr:tetratricopeptide repeat protein [Sphingomonas donggukensis]URW74479.1 hypothetical protein M9980_07745 [Sphingomonas donggukensis]
MIRPLGRSLAAAAATTVAVATPAAAEWREASSDHFIVYADSSESWLRNFAGRLERYDAALRLVRPVPEIDGLKSNRVVVYAVPSVEAVQKLCGRCGAVAGFYVPRVGGSVAFSARSGGDTARDISADVVLFHEYAHHYMLSKTEYAYPRWMTEGFAEFHATAKVDRDGDIDIGRPANHRAYNLINTRMPVTKVFDPPTKLDLQTQDQFYGRAWALYHMLTFDPARKSQLSTYLAAINNGKPGLVAAREAFGDLAALDKDLNAYIGRPIKFVPIKAAELKTGPIAVRTLNAAEAGMMLVRMQSDRGLNRAAALALIPEARRRAAAFPNDPAVQNALAEAEYDAGNDAEAEAAVDRVLAANPGDPQALLYKGRVLTRRAATAKIRDAKVWREARSWFLKANKADTDAAMPFVLFYRSFREQGIAPTPSAIAGLERAFELSPQDRGLRWNVAQQYLADGKMALARRTLLPLAYDPHGGDQAGFAARLIAAIDAGEAGAKLARERPTAAAAEGAAPTD